MTLRQIYNSLHAAGLVTSQRQFSREWLQKQSSYYSSSVSRSREPSLEVLLVLHNRIRRLVSVSPDKAEAAGQYRERLEQLVQDGGGAPVVEHRRQLGQVRVGLHPRQVARHVSEAVSGETVEVVAVSGSDLVCVRRVAEAVEA